MFQGITKNPAVTGEKSIKLLNGQRLDICSECSITKLSSYLRIARVNIYFNILG